jgi:hypothetical protein
MWITPCDLCGFETENIVVQNGVGMCFQCADSVAGCANCFGKGEFCEDGEWFTCSCEEKEE